MKTHADKTQTKKSESVANAISKNTNSDNVPFQFQDNRSQSIAQRKLKETINSKHQPLRNGASNVNTIQKKDAVIQRVEYIGKKDDKIHLHINIGDEDHLIVRGERYDLMVKGLYDKASVSAARKALKGTGNVKSSVACQKWLRDLYQNKWGKKHTREEKLAIKKQDDANRLKKAEKREKKKRKGKKG